MLRCGLIKGMVGLRDAAAGQVVLKLKTAWRDCTTDLVMSPLEYMQRLNALAPRRRVQARSCCCRG